MSKEEKNLDGAITQAITRSITDYISGRYDEMKKDFIKQLEEDKAQALAGISLHIMKMIDMQKMQDRIVITLKTES